MIFTSNATTPTVDMTLLQSFCAKASDRPNLAEPFTEGSFTHFASGPLIIRVPAIHGTVGHEKKPGNAGRLFLVHTQQDAHQPLPELPVLAVKRCDECGGTGKQFAKCERCHGEGSIECPECGHDEQCKDCSQGYSDKHTDKDCEECGGSGELPDHNQHMTLGTQTVQVNLLRKVSTLPNVRWANNKDALGPIHFLFDGGEGLLMPMRV